MDMDMDLAKRGVVTVGDGRGFIVESMGRRLVITAAHCLPELPPCHAASHTSERTYQLLGPLDGERTTWTEILFADPVADIAVLGPPDNQEYDEGPYRLLTEAAALTIGLLPEADPFTPARVLSLNGKWVRCAIRAHKDGPIWIKSEGIKSGMSGSPILAEDGSAVGVISVASETTSHMHGPNPRLVSRLPGFVLSPAHVAQ
jgi:hypothetical protein